MRANLTMTNSISETVVSKKNNTKVTLFILFLGLALLDSLTKLANDVARQITGQADVFGSLFWGDLLSINLIKVVLTAIIIGFCVAVYTYLTRDTRYSRSLLLGLSLWLFSPLILLLTVFIVSLLNPTSANWDNFNLSSNQIDFFITISLIQIFLIALTAKYGHKIGINLDYMDERDRKSQSIYGIRKFYWLLLAFPFNALSSVGVVASTRVYSKTVQQILSGTYSGGLYEISIAIMFPLIAWAIAYSIFKAGIESIRNTQIKKIDKAFRVILFLVVIPFALLIFIQP